jgi:hypothetical protein
VRRPIYRYYVSSAERGEKACTPHKLLQVQEEYQEDFQSSVRFTAVAYLLHQSLSASLQAYHYDFRHLLTGAIIMTLRQLPSRYLNMVHCPDPKAVEIVDISVAS